MKRTLYTVFSLFLFSACSIITVNAQDENIYMQYIQNPILMNVGVTGFHREHRILLDYRNIWAGFGEDAPNNYLVSYHTSLNGNMGLGGLVSHEQGLINRSRIKGSYAYHIPITGGKLGLGIGIDFQQKKIASKVLKSQLIDFSDVAISELRDGASYFDVEAGAYLEMDNGLVLALQLPDLIRSRIDETTIENDSSESTFLNYYGFFAGYKINFEDYDAQLYPSIYARKSFTFTNQVDINVIASFLDEALTTGVTYGINGDKRIGFLLGFAFNNVRLGYSYDLSRSDFQTYSGGGHEISIGFRFGKKEMEDKKLMENEVEEVKKRIE